MRIALGRLGKVQCGQLLDQPLIDQSTIKVKAREVTMQPERGCFQLVTHLGARRLLCMLSLLQMRDHPARTLYARILTAASLPNFGGFG